MNPDDKMYDAPTDPEELKARLYGIIVYANDGEVWHWDDPGPPPPWVKNPYIPPQPTPESSPHNRDE